MELNENNVNEFLDNVLKHKEKIASDLSKEDMQEMVGKLKDLEADYDTFSLNSQCSDNCHLAHIRGLAQYIVDACSFYQKAPKAILAKLVIDIQDAYENYLEWCEKNDNQRKEFKDRALEILPADIAKVAQKPGHTIIRVPDMEV